MVRKFPIECVLHSRCPVVTDTGWSDCRYHFFGVGLGTKGANEVYISIVEVELPRDCAHSMVCEFETLL